MRVRNVLALTAWLAAATAGEASVGCARATNQERAASTADTTQLNTARGSGAPASRAGSGGASANSTVDDGALREMTADSARLESEGASSPGYAVAPATASADVWRQIDSERLKLEAAVAAASPSSDLVHRYAFSVQNLFGSLPRRSPELSAAARTRIKEMAATVAGEAVALDRAAHAGDVPETRAALSRLKSTLASARSLYSS